MRGHLPLGVPLVVLILVGCAAPAPDVGSSAPTSTTPATAAPATSTPVAATTTPVASTPTTPAPPASKIQVDTKSLAFNASPGHAFALPVRVRNGDVVEANVSVMLRGVGLASNGTAILVPPLATRVVFVELAVPANATAGARTVNVTATDLASGQSILAPRAITVQVVAPARGYAGGDAARVIETIRVAGSDTVLATNDPSLLAMSFQRAPGYRAILAGLPIDTLGQGADDLAPGAWAALAGMQPGESRTVTFGAEQGFGNATVESTAPRVERIARERIVPLEHHQAAPEQLDQMLQESGQGRLADHHVGDVVNVTGSDGSTLPYRIYALSPQVDLARAVEVGERYTLDAAWPLAAVVIAVDDQSVTLRTDPPTAVGATFTWYSYWPNMTVLTAMDEGNVTLTHTPPVGLSYAVPSSWGYGEETRRVERLDETTIVSSAPDPDPLAGRALTVDLRLVDRGATRT